MALHAENAASNSEVSPPTKALPTNGDAQAQTALKSMLKRTLQASPTVN